jgi:uncharacterized protein (DUF4415 family)
MSRENPTRAVLTQDGRVLIEQPDGSYRAAASRSEWARVRTITDKEIEAAAAGDPDAPPLDEGFWREARVVSLVRSARNIPACASMRTVLAWFRARGPGYQTRMNAVLRAYVEAQKRDGR